jgi:8-oxo-dGTP diphosphatase
MSFAPLASLPKSVLILVKEAARHILKRPVIGVAAAARNDRGEWLLIRRADTGTWGLPGGTLEWGETMRVALAREVLEEAGVDDVKIGAVTGVYSRPDRDPRFHGVTVVVACDVGAPKRAPVNALEITDVRFFAHAALPRPLAFDMHEMLDDIVAGGPARLE